MLILGGFWLLLPPAEQDPTQAPGSPPGPHPAGANRWAQPADPALPLPREAPPTLLPGAEERVSDLHHPDLPPENDLSIVLEVLREFHRVVGKMPPGGENREILSALLGHNPGRMAFLPAGLPALSEQGELLDRWGNPYFLHPVSADRIEVISAGPDGRLWTGDDLGSLESPTGPESFAPLE